MINIIIPIVENEKDFSNFIDSINDKNVKIFVGILEKLQKDFSVKNKNVEIHVYNDKSNKEEIINSLHSCKLKKGKILVLRRVLSKEEYQSLTTSSKDIATLNSQQNKFISAFKRFMKTIVRKFFAFNFFEDISAICYNENMFELLSVCSNLSMATRINKYVGVELEEITTAEKPVKKIYSKSKNIFKLLLGTFFFLASLAGGILICIFTPLKALIVILVMFWIFFALTIWFVSFVNFTRTLAVGQLRFGRADEII